MAVLFIMVRRMLVWRIEESWEVSTGLLSRLWWRMRPVCFPHCRVVPWYTLFNPRLLDADGKHHGNCHFISFQIRESMGRFIGIPLSWSAQRRDGTEWKMYSLIYQRMARLQLNQLWAQTCYNRKLLEVIVPETVVLIYKCKFHLRLPPHAKHLHET